MKISVKLLICALAVIAAVIMTAGSPSLFAEFADEVKVVSVKGSPRIMKSGSSDWIDCKPDMKIGNGDRIKTGSDSEAEIAFSRDMASMVKIEKDSDMAIWAKNKPTASIDLFSGTVMARIKDLPRKSSFRVKTPTGISGVRGTGWKSRTNGQSSEFSAFENSIYVKGIDRDGNEMPGETIVESGFGTTVGKFEEPSTPERLPQGEMERWNGWTESTTPALDGSGDDGERDFSAADNLDKQLDSRESRIDAVSDSFDQERIQERLDSQSEKSSSQEDSENPNEKFTSAN